MRAALITTGSVLLTGTVIGNAFYHKKQFYPSVVYITKSSPSLFVIYIQCLVMFLLVGKLMRKIFFGTLRAAELEHLIERAWYAVTETCLAFTVYRDDLNARFVGIFAILLFLKCFHWLAEDRVDFMERSPNINILFHVRIVSLLTVLATCDSAFIYLAYHNTMTKGAGTQLVFGFEYAILLASILNIVLKYILHWIDIASDSPWDEKAVFLLYTELVMSILKVTLYLLFVGAMLKYHNFPLFALRPIYLSLRTLKKALCDVVMSRRAIRNMNTLYPDATQEELANTDNVCIICREEMIGNGTSKKLPCNHIFHVSCLRSWFQRQQTCPTCRMDILRIPNPLNPLNQARNNLGGQQGQQLLNNQPAGAGGAAGANVAGGIGGPHLHHQADAQNGTGPSGGSSGTTSGGVAGGAPIHGQTHLIIQNEMTAVMITVFAQMFVQAMLAHLQTLNQQPTLNPTQRNQHTSTRETRDMSTQTEDEPSLNQNQSQNNQNSNSSNNTSTSETTSASTTI